MRVKKYFANTEKEAIDQIKNDLGNDAIILGTKKVKKGGIFGFFGKKMLEVTVGFDTQQPKNERSFDKVGSSKDKQFELQQIIEKRQKEIDTKKGNNRAIKQVNEDSFKPLETNSLVNVKKDNSNENKIDEKSSDNESINEIKTELSQTKDMISNMMTEFKMTSFQSSLPKVANAFYELLLEQEIVEELAQKLIKQTMNKLSQEQVDDSSAFKAQLKTQLRALLESDLIETNSKKRPKVITLIGPTGVGKTTTVAKLAAQYTLVDKLQVGLITIDTYRIAAVEQLKTYGDILGLPVEVVLTPQELQRGLDKFSDKDVILVDTAGRSHKNEMQMTELKGFIENCNPEELYLVLSMGTRYKDIVNIVEKYRNINFSSFILTKVDETDHWGNLINLLSEYEVGCSYITTGQNVPDDLEVYQTNTIIKQILGEYYE
ncbi:flagellar biosynthesis protein FlhF [Natranaerobius trueperi]|uniref:Flagellar biosynthesis protein FlhF n=1 Tax=Natranaerobius trueperi TaxID=759412 RepID=A0A226C1F8_9FIRM|nr:flagellar biosynthesis protein FlhF [Natranaerobius trueperi]OWZ84247.1 flagellar biosynthesis protein FlhF [Natranaerobius trueperi]